MSLRAAWKIAHRTGIFLAILSHMIITKIKVVLPAKRRKEILEALKSFKKLAELSGGCQCCFISRDVDQRNTIIYWEEWQSRDDLERHIQSPQYRHLLELIEQSAKKPNIQFLTITKIEGLDIVKAVRIPT